MALEICVRSCRGPVRRGFRTQALETGMTETQIEPRGQQARLVPVFPACTASPVPRRRMPSRATAACYWLGDDARVSHLPRRHCCGSTDAGRPRCTSRCRAKVRRRISSEEVLCTSCARSSPTGPDRRRRDPVHLGDAHTRRLRHGPRRRGARGGVRAHARRMGLHRYVHSGSGQHRSSSAAARAPRRCTRAPGASATG